METSVNRITPCVSFWEQVSNKLQLTLLKVLTLISPVGFSCGNKNMKIKGSNNTNDSLETKVNILNSYILNCGWQN